MSENNGSERKPKSAYGLHTTKYPKDDERHWQQRVFHQKHGSRTGGTHEDKTYSVQINHAGRRRTFQLNIANKKAAGKKAREIFRSLLANGWDQTIDKHTLKKGTIPNVTKVDDLLRVYSELADVPEKTASNYARVFRTIVAEIKGIGGDKQRFDYVTGGAEKWRKKVGAVKLSDITPSKVQKWKLAYVKKRATDPLKEKSVKRTVNSYIRYGKSLFSEKVINHLKRELELPSPLPFDGVELFPRQSMRYESTFDIESLIVTAKNELPGIEHDQQWLIFILAVSTGLRRNEIDKLTWRQVDLQKMEISLTATKYFKPKSENSGTSVAIDPELGKLLQGYKAKGTCEFVIVENLAPNLKATVAHYRANRHFTALNSWLKTNGVEDRKPLHTLRKEAGSLVNKHHGLYAASRFLRHADIQVTSAHYVDSKEPITSGLGGLISGKVEPLKNEKEVKHG
ncbi:tyrosine-type recombinase/integrase [Akkermansiaceae bacterium]|nr:tyrosine-type recombinase/integrase [Akkermansiaceae bacterium]